MKKLNKLSRVGLVSIMLVFGVNKLFAAPMPQYISGLSDINIARSTREIIKNNNSITNVQVLSSDQSVLETQPVSMNYYLRNNLENVRALPVMKIAYMENGVNRQCLFQFKPHTVGNVHDGNIDIEIISTGNACGLIPSGDNVGGVILDPSIPGLAKR